VLRGRFAALPQSFYTVSEDLICTCRWEERHHGRRGPLQTHPRRAARPRGGGRRGMTIETFVDTDTGPLTDQMSRARQGNIRSCAVHGSAPRKCLARGEGEGQTPCQGHVCPHSACRPRHGPTHRAPPLRRGSCGGLQPHARFACPIVVPPVCLLDLGTCRMGPRARSVTVARSLARMTARGAA
jgi:hypothetical protein